MPRMQADVQTWNAVLKPEAVRGFPPLSVAFSYASTNFRGQRLCDITLQQ